MIGGINRSSPVWRIIAEPRVFKLVVLNILAGRVALHEHNSSTQRPDGQSASFH